MEVILNEDFASLGYVGDRVNVRRGYARNFLIPRGIAIDASTRNERLLKHRMAAITVKRAKLRSAAEEEATKLTEAALQFTLKMGKHGKTFGSVTAKDIAQALAAKGFVVDRKRVKLIEPLKRAGTFAVDIKLHAEVTVPLSIEVLAERLEEEKEEGTAEEGQAGKGAKRGKRGGSRRGRADKDAGSEDQELAKAARGASSEEE